MIGFAIDPRKNAELVETNGLDDYYKVIGCDCIDITILAIDGHLFNVVVDDEGLLKGGAVPSVYSLNGEPLLVNTAIVFGVEEDCELRSLTIEEVLLLSDRTYEAANQNDDRFIVLLAD